MIYKLLLEPSEVKPTGRKRKTRFSRYPQILRTCKEINVEASGILHTQLSTVVKVLTIAKARPGIGKVGDVVRYSVQCEHVGSPRHSSHYEVMFKKEYQHHGVPRAKLLVQRAGTVKIDFTFGMWWYAGARMPQDRLDEVMSDVAQWLSDRLSENHHLHTVHMNLKPCSTPRAACQTWAIDLMFEAMIQISGLGQGDRRAGVTFKIENIPSRQIENSVRGQYLVKQLGNDLIFC